MKIEFQDPALQELFETGKTRKNKFYSKLPVGVIKQFVKKVSTIRSANRIEDLYRINSLRYEKKGGNLAGQEAVYINDQYRLFFTSYPDSDTLIVTNIMFEKISKHYEN